MHAIHKFHNCFFSCAAFMEKMKKVAFVASSLFEDYKVQTAEHRQANVKLHFVSLKAVYLNNTTLLEQHSQRQFLV